MSMMRCDLCSNLVDTDDDPDSGYVQRDNHSNAHWDCVCVNCRDEQNMPSEFEEE